MTFSITARCPRTGDFGVAVTTCWFAVGSLCPAVRAGVGAVASQSFVNPALKGACLDRLANGLAPETALAEALAEDPSPEIRQVGLIGVRGRGAAHTGTGCDSVCGHLIETDAVIAGNMLAPGGVLDAVAAAWRANAELALAERMLGALEAGQESGGDKRGRQSAALLVGNAFPMLQLDLRVDDHLDPLIELRRLFTLYREKYEPIYRAMPTAERAD